MLEITYTLVRREAVQRVRDWLASLVSRERELAELAREQTIQH
jgi:hypothetical protein